MAHFPSNQASDASEPDLLLAIARERTASEEVVHLGVLWLVASPIELRAVWAGLVGGVGADVQIAPAANSHLQADAAEPVQVRPGHWVVKTGVGKVNAALTAQRVVDRRVHGLVINAGICGVLPAAQPTGLRASPEASIGQTVIACASVYGDEGIMVPSAHASNIEFIDLATMGFAPITLADGTPAGSLGGMGIESDARLVERIKHRLSSRNMVGAVDQPSERQPCIGTIATVSTCSGTDGLARAVARRTGAIAEAMEGAAIAHAMVRLFGTHDPATRPGMLEIRVISNTTGDRDKQVWRIPAALAELTRVVGVLTNPATANERETIAR